MRHLDKTNMAGQEAELVNEEIDTDEKCVGENDLKKLQDAHFKAGVREGITAGTQSTLQDGFNCGYKDAFLDSYNFGKVRGVLSVILSYVSLENKEQNCNNEKYKDRINKLISELENIEEKHSKMTHDTACDSDTNIDSRVSKRGHSSADRIDRQSLTVNDSSEFRKLIIQCKHLCDELGLDPDIVKIASYASYTS